MLDTHIKCIPEVEMEGMRVALTHITFNHNVVCLINCEMIENEESSVNFWITVINGRFQHKRDMRVINTFVNDLLQSTCKVLFFTFYFNHLDKCSRLVVKHYPDV